MTSLTPLLQKAIEVSTGQHQDVTNLEVTVFAEEAHRQLDKLVSASFQAFEANDPRPHARQVQKEELCKKYGCQIYTHELFLAVTSSFPIL